MTSSRYLGNLFNVIATRKALLWKTWQVEKEKYHKYVWTKNGKILTRKTDLDSVIAIETEQDLEKLQRVFYVSS